MIYAWPFEPKTSSACHWMGIWPLTSTSLNFTPEKLLALGIYLLIQLYLTQQADCAATSKPFHKERSKSLGAAASSPYTFRKEELCGANLSSSGMIIQILHLTVLITAA